MIRQRAECREFLLPVERAHGRLQADKSVSDPNLSRIRQLERGRRGIANSDAMVDGRFYCFVMLLYFDILCQIDVRCLTMDDRVTVKSSQKS
jgi:hypothetical protein